MPTPEPNSIMSDGLNPAMGNVSEIPTHKEILAINEKRHSIIDSGVEKEILATGEVAVDDDSIKKDSADKDRIIITGIDAAKYLLPLRDDHEPALTFRSILLATLLSGFQATMYQIYSFKPTMVTIQGTFIVLIAYFVGNGWAKFLPRGDHLEARWRGKGGVGNPPRWITVVSFLNHGPWNLKEHAICSITATSASNAAASIQVFAAQDIFYGLPLSATTVILTVISIGLFGYGVAGILRPVCVWHVDAVYWSTLPTVKTLQGLHWQEVKSSKPMRFFWYAFGSMFIYEFFPAYIFPWLNSVSIPCLAAMNATGSKAKVLTNIFGGSLNNEGLGLFSVSFDWQYITSFNSSLPLKLQLNAAMGYGVCYIAMLAIYYGNGWNSKSLPFMSTRLLTEDGSKYPLTEVFVGGVLDEAALKQYGSPKITGTFAYAMLMANAAIGALVTHCILFWGSDIKNSYKSACKGEYNDIHHTHMAKHYKETPWWWYALVLMVSFVLGLVVVLTQDVSLPAWGYIVALITGIIMAPFSCILYSRFGNGIATNNFSKMLAGFMIPGKPVGNMYFAAFSHNVISNSIVLCNDLKMGEYLKVAPRIMFLTQCYGTILGGFVNYAVMISIVNGRQEELANTNGSASWSGANAQSYNTNATTWALAKYLYMSGNQYNMVPIGMLIGAGVVAVHRIVVYFRPRVGSFSLDEINFPQFIQYAGFIPYNASQTCVIFSQLLAGFFVQFYLRNYRPRWFRDYSYLVTGAWDGASLFALFLLSFAVFGAGGITKPFPKWWGNNVDGYYDHCPVTE